LTGKAAEYRDTIEKSEAALVTAQDEEKFNKEFISAQLEEEKEKTATITAELEKGKGMATANAEKVVELQMEIEKMLASNQIAKKHLMNFSLKA